MSKAFGVQSPTQGEDPVSWQTWSDGDGSIPNVVGNADWGQLSLQLAGAEGRSAVYDLGALRIRKFILTENRYGSGSGSAALQIRGDSAPFTQDSSVVDWEDYVDPIFRNWQYVQVRETTFTYYFVDASAAGGDGGPGTRAAPWQTIAKVNASTFLSGDRVLFKRGETWSGTRLLPISSGITFGAYGTGAKPIISVAAAAPYAMYLDPSLRDFRVYDIDFRGGTQQSVAIYSTDTLLKNCLVSEATKSGILVWGNISNVILDGNISHNNGESGIELGSASFPGPVSSQIINNETYSNGTTNLHHGIYFKNSNGLLVSRNISHDNAGHGLNSRENNINLLVDKNESYANGYYGLYGDTLPAGSNITWSNNLIYANQRSGIAFGTAAGSVGIKIYNNTIVNNGAIADQHYGINMDVATVQNIDIRGNLIIQDSAVVGTGKHNPLKLYDVAQANGNICDYNLLYFPGGLGVANIAGTHYTFAQWQALSSNPDANSVNADPVFTTNYTDFHLQVTSPCRNAGLDGLVADDFDGVTRVAYDIGALEYVA